MTIRQLRRELHDLASCYFAGATVAWGQTKHVRPCEPLVSLRLGAARRPTHPISSVVDGIRADSYKTTATLEVNLFTAGVRRDGEGSELTAAPENTALDDMLAFANFIASQYAIDWLNERNITISMASGARDLSDVINDVAWDYRAMLEFDVVFTQSAVGRSGTMFEGGVRYGEDGKPTESQEFDQTPSGGGSQELANSETGWFNKVAKIKEDI